MTILDEQFILHHFPHKNARGLVYLDSAATSLTPEPVLDSMQDYYHNYRSNVSRGVYASAEQATAAYEDVRNQAMHFVGASDPTEIVFTSGTTHSINLIARGLRDHFDRPLHTVVTAMDHHANFVPWQTAADGGSFTVAPLCDGYSLDLDALRRVISDDTDILALPHVSNVLGTINPLDTIISTVRSINPHILIVVDAAQAAAHIPINVVDLDCDFLALSAHKMYGPTGTGILWGKKSHLEKLSPLFTGGEMISEVTSDQTSYRDLPHRLEAGTPNIASVIGLGSAISLLQDLSFQQITEHERNLTEYAHSSLSDISDLTLYGPPLSKDRIGVLSFTIDGMHPHDIASILDTSHHVAVRAGNHCAMPLHVEYLQIPATTRVSFGIYNTLADIDTLLTSLRVARDTLSR